MAEHRLQGGGVRLRRRRRQQLQVNADQQVAGQGGDPLPRHPVDGPCAERPAAARLCGEGAADEERVGRTFGVAQIGRASCRASVCQYVTIWWVAVSLKKKKATER